jgi:hypothetical protein
MATVLAHRRFSRRLAADRLREVAPPGWEGTVKAMKKHSDIDNPFALAWSMKNKGMSPRKKEDEEAGTSQGAKKGWQSRKGGAVGTKRYQGTSRDPEVRAAADAILARSRARGGGPTFSGGDQGKEDLLLRRAASLGKEPPRSTFGGSGPAGTARRSSTPASAKPKMSYWDKIATARKRRGLSTPYGKPR